MDLLSKSEVLKNGTYDSYMHFRRVQYDLVTSDNISSGEARAVIEQLESEFEPGDFTECERIYANARSRSKRIRRRVRSWFDVGFLYFVTLTFTDVSLERSTPESRRRAVTRFLSSHDWLYVANLDFGSRTQREHYHALVCTELPLSGAVVRRSHVISLPSGQSKVEVFFGIDAPEFQEWNETYGFSFVQQCNVEESDVLSLTRYLSKLTNHSIKESASSPRLIYCRKKPSWYLKRNRKRSDMSYERRKRDIPELFETFRQEQRRSGYHILKFEFCSKRSLRERPCKRLQRIAPKLKRL